MKEEEAKNKKCPVFALALVINVPLSMIATKSPMTDEDKKGFIESSFCQGYNCMLWRWDMDCTDSRHPVKSSTDGYCGLGGKP